LERVDNLMNVTAQWPALTGTSLPQIYLTESELQYNLTLDCYYNTMNFSAMLYIEDPRPDGYGWVFGVILGLAGIAGVILFFFFLVKCFSEAASHFSSLGVSDYSHFGTHYDTDNIHHASIFNKERWERHSFVRKVYLILTLQVAITFGVIAFFLVYQPARFFVQQYWWLILVGWGVCLVTLIPLYIFRKKPFLNFLLLIIFTLGFSVGVAFTCTYVGASIAFQAGAATVACFIFLTIFTFQTAIDFSFLAAGIFSMLIVIISFIILAIFIPFSSFFQLAYGLAVAILFCLYIIYDTAHLMEKFGPGDEILISVKLYIDLMYLLLIILSLFGGRK